VGGVIARILWRFLCRSGAFASDRSGNISIIIAICTPVFLAVLGLSFEVAQWYLAERAMQNAADSASVAAAMNGGTSAELEARAVAAQYGFVNGVDNVSVSLTANTSCPSGATTCYVVSITKPLPLYLVQLIGFRGNTTVNGQPMIAISSSSSAEQTQKKREYCILALAGLPGQSNTQGFRCNGCFKADLSGCNIMSNNTAMCNGHTTKADIGDAYSTNSGCGEQQNSYRPQVDDPYAALATQIPSNPCAGVYPQAPSNKSDPALPSSNQWSGARTINGIVSVCGDLQMTGDVDITNDTGNGGVLVIWNGMLDTNGHTFRTVAGYLTIVFAGTNGAYSHMPTGGGTLDFSAPRGGDWSGIAIYQAPSLKSGVDVWEAGQTPTWNITGMVYLPHASVTLSGAINKASTNGQACFGMVMDNITVNGTGFSLDACNDAGLVLPFSKVPGRGKLVR
jgi:Flp pilus assembly protein TadG